MKKYFKYLILLSVLTALLTVLAITASAEAVVATGSCGPTSTWTIYDVSTAATINYRLTISGTGTVFNYDKNGKSITYSTHADSVYNEYANEISEIVVEEGITAIGSYGFAFLMNVKKCFLPNSVTYLGTAAFENCTGLTTITRPGSTNLYGLDLTDVTTLGDYVFENCLKITKVTLSDNLKGRIGTQAFKRCKSLKCLVIPAGITVIKNEAFYECSTLKYVQFLGNTQIEEGAFSGCYEMKNMYGLGDSYAQSYAASNNLTFSIGEPNPEFLADDDAIASGDCGTDVYWQIKNEGTEEAPSYVFEVFGSGTTMQAYDASGTEINYGTRDDTLWHDYVPYIKKAVVGGNVTTLSNCALAFLYKVETIELSPKVKYFSSKVCEADYKLNCIYITGNTPEVGTVDLSNILTIGSYTFDGCQNIQKVIFSEDMQAQALETECFKNCRALTEIRIPAAFTYINGNAFMYCTSLKTVYFLGNPKIADGAFSYCSALETFYAYSDSYAAQYASAYKLKFEYPNEVCLYDGNDKIATVEVIKNDRIRNLNIDGVLYMLYNDYECTEPFDIETPIAENLALYAKKVVANVGFMVRASGYQGLRTLYSINLDQASGNALYNVVALGAIASKKRGIRMNNIDVSMNYINSVKVIENNMLVGKLVATPSDTNAKFAYTATGFEDENGKPVDARCTSKLYFRSYITLENKVTHKLYTFYTDMIDGSLYEKCASTVEAGANILSDKELSFIKTVSNLSVTENSVYTKAELLSLLNAVYADPNKYIVGQHCDYANEDTFANFLDKFYNETGELLGLIALDQGTMNRSGALTDETRAQFVDDIVAYAKLGGIFSLSFHMDNPSDASLYCRGTLGTGEKFDELMTTGTELNDTLMASLETAARTLNDLKTAGVPVLFRPLHEINGGWFWWCTIQNGKTLDASYTQRLWQYFYNYFDTICGLDNLIWVYSPNYTNSNVSPAPVMYCYPGDDYVDIVGCDWYTSSATISDLEGAGKSYSTLVNTGKIAAITEFGTRGLLTTTNKNLQSDIYSCLDELATYKAVVSAGYSLTYVLNWNGSHSYLYYGKAKEYMQDPMTMGAADNLQMLFDIRAAN